jgi:2-keto-3-deoxy-L-rhamnonate aldolase RhmA
VTSVPLERLRGKLREGRLVLGMQHSSGSEAVVELLGWTGFDFVLLDMEHAAYGVAEAERLIRAADAADIAPFVRVGSHDPHLVGLVLDLGAVGVLVPHVRTGAECAALVAATRFPPLGSRGKSGASRAARWGLTPWAEHEAWSNTGPLLVPIVEDREAVERLDEIVATPGLELVAVGPGDLSQSYGEPGLGLRSVPVRTALERTIALAAPRGIGVMTIPAPDMDAAFVREIAAAGARVVWYGGDLPHAAALFRRLLAELEEV